MIVRLFGLDAGSSKALLVDRRRSRIAHYLVGLLALSLLLTACGHRFTTIEYPIQTISCNPGGIVAGPDGALWFTQFRSNEIARITAAGVVVEYHVPVARRQPDIFLVSKGGIPRVIRGSQNGPMGITVGPDHAIWFTDGNKIGRITTAGALTEFSLRPEDSMALSITRGPDGALWFTKISGGIGRITTVGSISEFPLNARKEVPFGIVTGSDGALWFTEFQRNRIGRMTTAGVITEFPIPTPAYPRNIAAGPDGALWFTGLSANKIGRITTAGVITEFPVPTQAYPLSIAAGPDGALWFTEPKANKIGRITTAGIISELSLPAMSHPTAIATGPNGTLWFTACKKIGRIQP